MCKYGVGCFEATNGYCLGDMTGNICGEKEEIKTPSWKKPYETYETIKGERKYFEENDGLS